MRWTELSWFDIGARNDMEQFEKGAQLGRDEPGLSQIPFPESVFFSWMKYMLHGSTLTSHFEVLVLYLVTVRLWVESTALRINHAWWIHFVVLYFLLYLREWDSRFTLLNEAEYIFPPLRKSQRAVKFPHAWLPKMPLLEDPSLPFARRQSVRRAHVQERFAVGFS